MTVFIKRGEPYLTKRQAEDRGRTMFESEMAGWKREAAMLIDPEGYKAWASSWVQSNVENSENNAFNKQLHDYREALKRLAKYRLADGRDELSDDKDTGHVDQNGDPIIESVVVQTAIEPLPAEVGQSAYDDATMKSSTVMVPNPAIVRDDEERAKAQVVINDTPKSVKDFRS